MALMYLFISAIVIEGILEETRQRFCPLLINTYLLLSHTDVLFNELNDIIW